jgi:protoheme IX farnesyltransferase
LFRRKYFDIRISSLEHVSNRKSIQIVAALRVMLELMKVRITAAVMLTTATGYVLAARRLDWDMCIPLLGVFSLASGSAALNQWQEGEIDARMKRTCGRPIPAGRIDPLWALFFSVLLILVGLFLLTSAEENTYTLLALGGMALFWYNGVYTYLKRVTAFAVVPGALIGAIPPVMGYVSAGGSLHDPGILLVATFFFLWQIPHFWLLLLMLGDEYCEAGLPTVTSRFARSQLQRISFVWILATAAGGLAFTAVNRVGIALPWNLVLLAASFWLAARAAAILRVSGADDNRPRFRRAFWQINAYAVMVMICLSLGALDVEAGLTTTIGGF